MSREPEMNLASVSIGETFVMYGRLVFRRFRWASCCSWGTHYTPYNPGQYDLPTPRGSAGYLNSSPEPRSSVRAISFSMFINTPNCPVYCRMELPFSLICAV